MSSFSQAQEMYVLAQSHARINKERAMRRRKLKWLWARLKRIAATENLSREEDDPTLLELARQASSEGLATT